MNNDLTGDEAALIRLLDAQAAAWAGGDGAAFAATFSEDADFVSVIGEFETGRTKIAQVMQEGLDGFMRDTRWSPPRHLNIRFPAPGTAVIVTDGVCVLRNGAETCRTEDLTIQIRTAVKADDRWLFTSFQNTRITPGLRENWRPDEPASSATAPDRVGVGNGHSA